MAANATFSDSGQRTKQDDEDSIIVIEKKDIQVGVERCSRSLVGRLWADKQFSVGTIEPAMQAIWRQPEGFKVIDHGGNVFQFFFQDERDVIRIERGAPWLFKNYILNLKWWKEDEHIGDLDFTQVPMWIQFWGLPEHYKTKDLGWKLGCSFGDVLDVDIFQVRGKEHSIVKVQVSLAITRPIKRSLRIVGPNNKVLEVGLKYERIGNFCNYCGYVGHEARMCSF
ncbi:uncharacterized protein [Arachis hypogaea]|uniref:uncharacterized protein n=1 Tax=Arachis hypogaea TaxID=3818 RepID=UPI000DEC609B|nr:uncharacterized protein LOC112772875 [Arachis hypogaea]